MKRIEILDNIKAAKDLEDAGIHWKVHQYYREAHDRDLEHLDFSDCVFESEAKEIVDSLRKCGIGRFTISNGFSGMNELIHNLEANGCKLVGMTMVHSKMRDWNTNEFELVPAFDLVVGFAD